MLACPNHSQTAPVLALSGHRSTAYGIFFSRLPRSRKGTATIQMNLRRRQNLLPDPEVIAAEDQPNVIVAEAALGKHLDERCVVLADSLGLDTCAWFGAVTLDFESYRIHLVVTQPADADVFD